MTEPTPAPQARPLASLAELEDGIDQLIGLAQHRVDVFAHALGPAWRRPGRLAALRRFCLASRRNECRVVLHQAASLRRDCPSLVPLVETFAHVISVRETRPEAQHASDGMVLVDGRHLLHRFHADSARGILTLDDPEAVALLAGRFTELWESSDPASPATTLGL